MDNGSMEGAELLDEEPSSTGRVPHGETEADLWHIRATAWELAAFSFRHPTRELAQAVASGEWLAAAREIAEALDLALPNGFGEGVPGVESPLDDSEVEAFFHALRAEATRLFVGPAEPACSPYEGVWRAKAEGVKPLLFVNPHSMEAERFMRKCGFTRPAGTNDPLDHIATECELLEALALRAARATSDADEVSCARVMNGDDGTRDATDANAARASELYAQFLDEHVRAWANNFCAELSEGAREPFFQAAAAYLQTLL